MPGGGGVRSKLYTTPVVALIAIHERYYTVVCLIIACVELGFNTRGIQLSAATNENIQRRFYTSLLARIGPTLYDVISTKHYKTIYNNVSRLVVNGKSQSDFAGKDMPRMSDRFVPDNVSPYQLSDNGCMHVVFTCNGKEALLLPTYPRTTWLCMDNTRHSMAAPGQPRRDTDPSVISATVTTTHNTLNEFIRDHSTVG